jgi:hypothetical protein
MIRNNETSTSEVRTCLTSGAQTMTASRPSTIEYDGILIQLRLDRERVLVEVDEATVGFAALRGSNAFEVVGVVAEAANNTALSVSERFDEIRRVLGALSKSRYDIYEQLKSADFLLTVGAAVHRDPSIRAIAAGAQDLPASVISRLVLETDSNVAYACSGNPDPRFDSYRERYTSRPECAVQAWIAMGRPADRIDEIVSVSNDWGLRALALDGAPTPPQVHAELIRRAATPVERLEGFRELDRQTLEDRVGVLWRLSRVDDELLRAMALLQLLEFGQDVGEAIAKDPSPLVQLSVLFSTNQNVANSSAPDWLMHLHESDPTLVDWSDQVALARACSPLPRDRLVLASQPELALSLRAVLLNDPEELVRCAASFAGSPQLSDVCLECGTDQNHSGDHGYDCLIRTSRRLLDDGVLLAASDTSVPASIRRIWPAEFRSTRTVGVRLNSSKYGKYSRQTVKVCESFIIGMSARELGQELAAVGRHAGLTTVGYGELISDCRQSVSLSTLAPSTATRAFLAGRMQ